MAEKLLNKIIVLEPSTKSVTELLALVEEKGGVEVVRLNSPEEVTKILVGSLPCLFITSMLDNNVVPARVQLLKRLEPAIKQHGLKVYMVTGIKNRQLSDLFTQKMGVTDYIVDPVPVRTMLFKVNLALKAVENFRKQQELKRAAQEQIIIKKSDGKKTEAAQAAVPAKGKPALQMAEDTFLFKNGAAKKAGKKFVLEVEGPDPSTGEWVQHTDKGDAKSAWRWVPNEEKEAQASGAAPADGWVHDGDKPSFNEETGKWAMSSETPALALKKAGKTVAEKISLDENGELVVAEDSPEAEANLQKNKVQAAVAIKEREEKQRVIAEKKKDAENSGAADGKSNVLSDLANEEDEQDNTGPKDATGVLEKKSSKAKKAKSGSGALESLMNTVESDESDEPSEFNNHLDGKKEQLRSVVDKREVPPPGDSAEPQAEASKSTEEEKTAPKTPSPLDFLKKKKEQLQQAALASGVNTIKADAPRTGANPLKENAGEDDGPSAGILNRKDKKGAKSSPAADRLARLRAGLAESDHEDEEASEAPAPTVKEDEPEPVADSSFSPQKPDKKRESPVLQQKAANEESSKGSPKLKLSEKKKKTLEAIQAKLLAPLPEEMSPEGEAELRKELGLEGRPEIKVKELARKKRLAEVQRMKDLLAEIDKETEYDGEVISSSAPPGAYDKDRPGETGDLSRDKLKGIRSAVDNESGQDEEDAEERKKLGSSSGEEKAKRGASKDDAFYMPEAELLPKGNAWESTDGYYVYLNAQVRYKGFESIEEVLPLWIFKGSKQPELLDKTKQWRFYGSLPVAARKESELPATVKDYLLAIRDQLLGNKPKAREDAVDNSGEKGKNKKDKKSSSSSALDRLRAELAASSSSEDPDEVAAELSGESAEDGAQEHSIGKSKFKPGGEISLPGEELNGLKARRARGKASADSEANEELTDTEESSSAAKSKGSSSKKSGKSSAAAGLDSLARLREKMKAAESREEDSVEEEVEAEEAKREKESASEQIAEDASEAPAERRAEKARAVADEAQDSELPEAVSKKAKHKAGKHESDDEPEEESLAPSAISESEIKNRKASSKKSSSALDRLREKLGESAEPEAEPETTEPEELNAKKDTPEMAAPSIESKAEPEDTSDSGHAPNSEASDAVRKFMERRKNKPAKETIKQEKAPVDASARSGAVYLGIYVSLSDSLAQEKEAGIAVPRVLKAFEESFGDCAALCTGLPDNANNAEVRFCSPASPDATTRVQLNSGIFEPIATGDGEASDLLGYLYLQARGARSVFSEAEKDTIRRIARKLWPIFKRDSMDSESEAA